MSNGYPLFSDQQPDAGGKNLPEVLNPNRLTVVTAYVEPSLAAVQPDQKFQFERHGYLWPAAKTTVRAGKWSSTG
jgi:hypothetical protein